MLIVWMVALHGGLVGLSSPPQAASTMPDVTGTTSDVPPLAKWKVVPSRDLLARYFGKASLHRTKAGYVEISCVAVQPDRLTDCVKLSEPPGTHYARALILAAQEFRVIPPSINGVPQFGSRVRVHLTVEVPR